MISNLPRQQPEPTSKIFMADLDQTHQQAVSLLQKGKDAEADKLLYPLG
jgi:hypothetical protein